MHRAPSQEKNIPKVALEFNLVSLVSPTHGLHPKKAALEGLATMKMLMDFGVPQIIFPEAKHFAHLDSTQTGHSSIRFCEDFAGPGVYLEKDATKGPMGHKSICIIHEKTYEAQATVLEVFETKCREAGGFSPTIFTISESLLSLRDAEASSFFESQIIDAQEGGMMLIAPARCEEVPSAKLAIQSILASDLPIHQVTFVNMCNHLRLRIVLTPQELAAMHQGVLLTEPLYEKLVTWVQRNYRDRLEVSDLLDPELLKEIDQAYQRLWPLLKLP